MLSPTLTDFFFVGTVVFVLAAIEYGLGRGLERLGYASPRRQRIVVAVCLATLVWYGVIAIAADRGFFMDFASLPPKFFFAIVPTMIVMLILAFSRPVKRIAEVIPRSWPIGLQTFRVAIEIVLWQLAMQGRISPMMSFEGNNFDVITGVTAPLIAWVAGRSRYRWIVTLWNFLGLVLLTNVMVRGILSAPTRFQMIHSEPPNAIIGTFPYIWLPCIAVVAAYFLHIVSLRQSTT